MRRFAINDQLMLRLVRGFVLILILLLLTGICLNFSWEASLQEPENLMPLEAETRYPQVVWQGTFLIGFMGVIVIFKERQIGRGPPRGDPIWLTNAPGRCLQERKQ